MTIDPEEFRRLSQVYLAAERLLQYVPDTRCPYQFDLRESVTGYRSYIELVAEEEKEWAGG